MARARKADDDVDAPVEVIPEEQPPVMSGAGGRAVGTTPAVPPDEASTLDPVKAAEQVVAFLKRACDELIPRYSLNYAPVAAVHQAFELSRRLHVHLLQAAVQTGGQPR